jgi:hypothetical protein
MRYAVREASDVQPAEQAVRDGRRMTPSTVAALGARLQDAGENSTLAQALQGEDGAEALNHLVKDGVFTQQEAKALARQRHHGRAKGKPQRQRNRDFPLVLEIDESRPQRRDLDCATGLG